jgi:hypothetical protein
MMQWQIELVKVNVESWEDVFQEDELDEDEVARSPFSRWEIQDDTLLPMLLAIRTSVPLHPYPSSHCCMGAVRARAQACVCGGACAVVRWCVCVCVFLF